ncbi:MAG: acyl-CoA/acyl-ACP dehydrogenase [Pseudomonadales bacterium]|nr:acyl-CoA/acyl-ACP dehydrogenase [Halieaceae bacterium]MCP5164178.1 acyl-CoA/acyl-ACP dehydrogenase [Pseudomonadales bacterium]MCP5190738.1 acyl-CoA/acyl-ACP dehydrogenase [Pseudomonadales bacterium]MCP5203746.1 acyl-CoA/acyl-ACP dehydrogenase [Pseudomonadales bacterium]
MSDVSPTGGQLLEQAAIVLADTQTLIDKALSALKAKTVVDGKLSNARLDDNQLVSYELSLCWAECCAARFMLDHASSCQDDFTNRLCGLFCAEAVTASCARLRARLADFGLADTDVSAVLEGPVAATFLPGQLAAANIAAIGEEVMERGANLGPDALEERYTMMRDSFHRFADEVVMPLAEAVHREDLIIPDEILEPLKEMGVFGLSIPESYGGLQEDDQEDTLGMIIVTEELSRGSLGAAGSLITRPEILSRALLKGGTEEQKQHWLPKLAVGEPLCAVAVTEPNYGSDVAGVKLRATPCEGGWRLNGAKTWCTFGGKAGVLMVLARTNPDPAQAHRGLSMFLVEKPSSDGHEFEVTSQGGGTLTGRAIATIGYRGMHSYELFFDDFFVPAGNMMGGPEGEGRGFYLAMAGFAGGRIQTAGRAVGVMRAAFEKAISYSGERVVFSHPIGDYQLTRVKLARMAAHLAACRQITYGVARLMDQGKGDMEASGAKLFTCKTAEWFTREALQIHGGMGYAEEVPVSRYFVDARVLSIFEGAEETLALKVITRSLVENAA